VKRIMDAKYKIHAFYIIGILLSIIVVLLTNNSSGIPNLGEKISFALTLASLILAVLAIGYAVYSNATISQTTSILNDASRNISNTATDISKAAQDLVLRVEEIPTRLDSVEGKVVETNVLLRQFSEQPKTSQYHLQKKKSC
jgi:predicted PurR-regulated permease PerM